MDLQEKIKHTLLAIFCMFILIKMMRFINDDLKLDLSRSNPKLLSDRGWFFSEKKKKVIDFLIIGMSLIWIYMIWSNQVEAFFFI